MPVPDRITALGMLVQVTQASGPAAMSKYKERCLKAAKIALEQTEDAPLRRNAAYFLGVMVEHGEF